ncbi:helix-turn-helix domain-containing protein [Gordonia malaquae]|uniref:helix-turn-helix domain-containing protein n=1 Tax=Gordonia malaquae TaxID=410332 RepID=UPI0030178898
MTDYFVMTPDRVLDMVEDSELPPTSAFMLTVLVRMARKQGGGPFLATRQEIARGMGMARKQSVDPHLKNLQDAGLVEVAHRWKNRAGDVRTGDKGEGFNEQVESEYTITGGRVDDRRSPPNHGDAPERTRVVRDTAPGLYVVPNHADAPDRTLPIEGSEDKEQIRADGFEEWWTAYPKRSGKGQARTAYRAALKKVSAGELLAGAERYRDDRNRKPDYTKNASTWLNGECWADEVEVAKASGPDQRWDRWQSGV